MKIEVSKNIGISLIAKTISLVVSFVSVPLLLSYLGKDTYGVWLTLFSIISWMSFFDFGLGNGLRNYLTINFTNNNIKKAQEYISTGYYLLGGFIVVATTLLQFFVFFVDWNAVFRPPPSITENFNVIISICLWGFGGLLITRLIVSVLQAKKEVGKSNLLMSVGSLISLILLFSISKIDSNVKLYNVAWIFAWSTPVVMLLYSIKFFRSENKSLRPIVGKVKKALARDVFGLGLEFFIIQFLILVLNQSSNIIITQVLSPSAVAVYYIPLRLFSIISIGMGLISSNLLPYFTEANAKQDFLKMKRIVYKFFKIFFIITVVFIIVLVFSKQIIQFWTGNQIKVPFSLIVLHFLLALIGGVNGIFSSLLNGVGMLKRQMLILGICAFLFIPLAVFLGKKMGLNGIVLSLIIVQLPILVTLSLQTMNFLNKNISKMYSGT